MFANSLCVAAAGPFALRLSTVGKAVLRPRPFHRGSQFQALAFWGQISELVTCCHLPRSCVLRGVGVSCIRGQGGAETSGTVALLRRCCLGGSWMVHSVPRRLRPTAHRCSPGRAEVDPGSMLVPVLRAASCVPSRSSSKGKGPWEGEGEGLAICTPGMTSRGGLDEHCLGLGSETAHSEAVPAGLSMPPEGTSSNQGALAGPVLRGCVDGHGDHLGLPLSPRSWEGVAQQPTKCTKEGATAASVPGSWEAQLSSGPTPGHPGPLPDPVLPERRVGLWGCQEL